MKGSFKGNFKLIAPIVMSAFACGGVAGTAVLAAKASPRALKLIEADKNKHRDEPQTKLDRFRVAWKCFLPTVGAGLGTMALIAGSTFISHRAQVSLIGAGAAMSQFHREYQKKVREVVGEEKEKEVLQAVAIDKYNDAAFIDTGLIGVSSQKEALFYDPWGKRYFTALTEDVRNAEYHVNRNFAFRGAVGVNELYTFIGIEPLENLQDVGWSVDDEFQWIDFEHVYTKMEDGLEVYILSSRYDPVPGFEYGYWDAWEEQNELLRMGQ